MEQTRKEMVPVAEHSEARQQEAEAYVAPTAESSGGPPPEYVAELGVELSYELGATDAPQAPSSGEAPTNALPDAPTTPMAAMTLDEGSVGLPPTRKGQEQVAQVETPAASAPLMTVNEELVDYEEIDKDKAEAADSRVVQEDV